ncbi:MAG: hypothetical protein GOVbin2006_27 [Prokaryotic dsDNA virus sp.]|nr:MAG: hypothetical protein GOVbin2006_27 [Prokaryotic dsDNA virus sp.]
MNRYFVTDEVYKERMNICRSCVYYFKPTGQCKRCMCFMKIKSRLAPLDCPEKYWTKTTEMKQPEDLPPEIVEEVLNIWEEIKGGRAKTQKDKKKMIELHNYIYNTNYSWGTNCGSCLNSCFNNIKTLVNLYK